MVEVVGLGYLSSTHVLLLRHGEATLLHRELAHALPKRMRSGTDSYHRVPHLHLSILLLNRLVLAINIDLSNDFLNKAVQLVHLMLMPVNLGNDRLQGTLDNLVVGDVLCPQPSD